ncbi:beta-arrestin-1-like isoform X1 [Actinia tenebrosa]|uniref:Beta-arrestin-1-like isoform X1 n=1 Tax=Actinia tenebrosa TaxID=6105 RepID=A0A6P8IEZ3_ACTTE|nr:beta-arrestin-1-like isoform X1 [Actinia tenebrosa]
MESKDKENPSEEAAKRTGTRVFKKTSPSGKITTYLGKRDFIDHIEHIDPVDGVVLVDPEYVKDGKKVYAHVLAAFRYGREDLDVLGLTFRKDLFLATVQVYPPKPEDQKPMTRLQERLLKKLGSNAYPFKFDLPPGSPSSVTLQPAPGDTGKPCGVDYELKTYVSESAEEKPHKRDTVRLAIRKLTYAPERPQPQPFAEAEKDFMMSSYPLHVEASLDKGLYYHGETIAVNIHVSNRSSKTCKKVKITVRQFADICLFSTAQYKCPVAVLESEDGFPVGQSGTLSKVYCLTPLLDDNRDKRGLALDGKLKHEDTNLASSTTLDPNIPKENLGIIVQYKVKVRIIVAYGGDLTLELPFMLTHPKPIEEPTPPPTPSKPPNEQAAAGGENSEASAAIDHNLIDFDTDGPDKHDKDDLIFEDFARLRLKGTDLTESADA